MGRARSGDTSEEHPAVAFGKGIILFAPATVLNVVAELVSKGREWMIEGLLVYEFDSSARTWKPHANQPGLEIGDDGPSPVTVAVCRATSLISPGLPANSVSVDLKSAGKANSLS